MSSPPRTWLDIGPEDYRYVTDNVEAMTDQEIAQELGVTANTVARMRSELGYSRKTGNSVHGKITSPGIEPIATFERRMKDRLEAEGVTGDEARMFMRAFLLDRAKDIERNIYRMRLHDRTGVTGKEYMRKAECLKAECYFKINTYER